MPSEQRVVKGLAGREWAIESGFTTDAMCKTTSESIDTCFSNFKPRSKYTLINTKKATPAKVEIKTDNLRISSIK